MLVYFSNFLFSGERAVDVNTASQEGANGGVGSSHDKSISSVLGSVRCDLPERLLFSDFVRANKTNASWITVETRD